MDQMNPFNKNAPQLTEPVEPVVNDPNNPAADPNAPAPVSQEEFKKLQDDLVATKENSNKIIGDLNAQVLQSNQLMQNGMANYTPQGGAPTEEPITEEQVMEAMNGGEPGSMKLMKKFIQQSSGSEIESLKAEMKTMREQGQQSLSKLAQGAGTQNLTYYDKYKEEIDKVVAGSAAHLQTDPETYRQAHNFVAGQHMEEIVAEAIEAKLRSNGDEDKPGSATVPSGGSNQGRNIEQGKVDLSYDNVFSKAALNQLRLRGVTPEQHAKNTGFANYDEFAKYKLEGEGRMISNEPANA